MLSTEVSTLELAKINRAKYLHISATKLDQLSYDLLAATIYFEKYSFIGWK